jgi:hypothetical protein
VQRVRSVSSDQDRTRFARRGCQGLDEGVEAALEVPQSFPLQWRAAGGGAQPDLAPEPDHGYLIVVAAKLGPELRAEGAVIGALAERAAQPGGCGDPLEPLPIAHPLQVGRHQPQPNPVLNRQETEAEQIDGAVQRPDAPVRKIADVRRQPDEPVADADLLRQRHDLAVTLEEMVVKPLDSGPRHRKRVGLPAQQRAALPECHANAALCQPIRGGQPGDATADDGDVEVVGRRSWVVSD